ncbi:type III pantothenate kinase [Nitrosomonas sp. Nm166]|uniref:type III pantothenate kinase n=1 Tax=Nitrosomonas sp. Nm166 TaxID=1881054 RepID=UPI0008E44BAA|nr:type III pantothenate kinase [Nitrosomonas sp. Nm166]SFE88135.1 type III pantothenate kinase [Nitrosomonas sp. Nm166]
MPYILAIDSGNSYVKWGLYANHQWLKKGKVCYTGVSSLEKEFADLPEPSVIVVSHVARVYTRDQLDILLSVWPVKPHWIVAQAFQCSVFNNYLNPTQLGSDRWAALIAAWKIQGHACLVINVGTALTIDALSDSGEFLGGIIVPGIHLIRNSLLSGTQLITTDTGNYKEFPQNTDDGVRSGVIQCLIGAIERMYNLLSLQLSHPVEKCVMSGGGVSELIPFIKFPITIIDNLVLEGLVVIADDLQ